MAEDAQLSIVAPEEQFMRRLFQSYYEKVAPDSVSPPEIARREFGLGTWDKKIESRHFAFRDAQALKSYLVRNTPFYISYSAAYYEFPDGRPMPRKGWMGADLVFDLDSDHLELECMKTHPKKFPCANCLSAVREETMKLIEDFLVPDFGFSKGEISANFSGNRGYHVHVRNETVRQLAGWARRELADYILGAGLQAKSLFYSRVKGKLEGPTPEMPGWHGRIARRFLQLLQAGKLTEAGVEQALARRLQKNAAKVSEGIIMRGNWDTVRMNGPEKDLLAQKIIDSAGIHIEGVGRAGDEVDVGVTFDVSKLIRLPDSLHGETGMAARKIAKVGDLARFEPMNDAIVFSDAPVKVKVGEAPAFVMGNQTFGPFKNSDVELPEFAAAYLICKREAKLWK